MFAHAESAHPRVQCNICLLCFYIFVAEVQLLQQSQWKKVRGRLIGPACHFILSSSERKAVLSPVPSTHSNERWYWQTGAVLEIESTIQKAEIASYRQKNSKSPSTKGNIDRVFYWFPSDAKKSTSSQNWNKYVLYCKWLLLHVA